MNGLTLKQARDLGETIGGFMESRHFFAGVDGPIQTVKMPHLEKVFFTVYAMNLVIESDGFGCLVGQEPVDVQAFIKILHKLGAPKTSAFVSKVVDAAKANVEPDNMKCGGEYYRLFDRERVYPKIVDYLGGTICMRYHNHAQAIDQSGGNIFRSKEWQGRFRRPESKRERLTRK